MKIQKNWPFILVVMAMALLLALPASAQSSKKKKKKKSSHKTEKKVEKKESDEDYFDEGPVKLKDKLYYGGGFNLGFGSYNNQSLFSFGLSPMVGYKIWGPFSAGPRVAMTFNSFKEQGVKALNLIDWETGLFTRVKFKSFPIFLHGEISNLWLQRPEDYDFPTQKWTKSVTSRVNQYVGLGYNSGFDGGPGYEIMATYNFALANDINTSETPWNFRIGFTWKF